jgi:hypothetical protein
VPEHPTPSIPPIDPGFSEEVKHLTEESYLAFDLVRGLSKRVGRFMEVMDLLQHDLDDASLDRLREITNYEQLMDAWASIAGEACAAADHNTDLPEPSWYRHLIEKRHARFEAVA